MSSADTTTARSVALHVSSREAQSPPEIQDLTSGKIRILNLEDNPNDSDLIQVQLERSGVPCEVARVDTEAAYLQALRQGEFDVVIADFSLPSFDGRRSLELAHQLRPDIPFLFFSGTLGEESAVESLHNGAADYVLKQRPARLASAVQRALHDASVQRQRCRTEEDLRTTQRELSLKNRIANIFLTIPDSSLFGEVLRTILEVTQSRNGVFGYIDEQGVLVCSSVAHPTVEDPIVIRFPREEWSGPWAALAHKGCVCTNEAGAFLPVGRFPVHRMLMVPLLYRDEVIGHFAVANKTTDYNRDDRNLLESIATYLAPVLKVRLERDAHEKALSDALAVKEVLLQEVHHRVKNNLQIISSLLSIQAKSLPEKEQELLRDSQTRIRAMALVHEQLHQHGNPGVLDFGYYAKNLATGLLGLCRQEAEHIELRFDIEPVLLDVNQSIPCALILNELVTNSLKYAFPDKRRGEVLVRVARTAEGQVELRVADNGVGVEAGFDWRQPNSLGLQIVNVLARQLDGTVHCTFAGGVAFTMTFEKR